MKRKKKYDIWDVIKIFHSNPDCSFWLMYEINDNETSSISFDKIEICNDGSFILKEKYECDWENDKYTHTIKKEMKIKESYIKKIEVSSSTIQITLK